jgi:ERCC4-related helicase
MHCVLNTRHGVKVLLDHLCALEKAASELKNDKQLHALFGGADKLKVRKFFRKGTKTVSEPGASQEITRQHFLTGKCNLLLTTSVAEEGPDFPACNTVIMMIGADNDISLKSEKAVCALMAK